QPVEIARLELVRGARQRGRIADAVVAGAALEDIVERERDERRVATRAAAGDDAAVAVDQPLVGEESGSVDAVVDVDDAPLPVQPVAVLAAIAGAAAVVDVEHRDAAAGPVLGPQVEGARGGRGRAAVTLDEERRLLARRRR